MTRANHDSDAICALSPGALSILDVAERLFAEKGFDAVSINDIAQQADVSKANIFHHFKSKEGLYLAALKSACEHAARALDDVEQSLSSDSPQAQLQAFFTQHLQELLASPRSTRLIQRELLESGSERGRRLAEEVFSENFSRLVELVRTGQVQGQFRQEFDAALVAFLLIGTSVFFTQTSAVLQHLPGAEFAKFPDDYGSAVFQLLSHGFQNTT
ncbi:MAG: TetR/AcrR family transcriptional regulator [Gammaproteobacteria bacterium]|nr:MAG: TetR/AcrR family transcriptional regulator [Gammaproteobacteria bacterium]